MIRILIHDPIGPSMMPRPEEGPDADPPFEVVFDPDLVETADAVVFHIPSLLPVHPRKRPGQVWVAWSMESVVNYPALAHPPFMRQFDLSMTYRLDADIWVPYLDQNWESLGAPPPPKTDSAPAVIFVSNVRDRSGRLDYVRDLLRHIPVDCYGSGMPNRALPGDSGLTTKLETTSRYRFTLAFENSIAPDYVTEKLFDALAAGSVPVYLGAPNVADFAPGERCLIDVSDFAGPGQLASHLRALATDEGRYQEYHAWRKKPLRVEFQALLDRVRVSPFARLARRVRDLQAAA